MRSAVRVGVVLLICGTFIGEPLAVVNQVNGLVVPVQEQTPCPGTMSGCIQTGLNYGEGANPPTSGPLDAVLDANTGPETFLVPKTGNSFNKVTFRLLQEGAGFENIFGWYNVEDPSKRYPTIFSCRGGNRSTYEAPTYDGTGKLVGGYTTTVDFQAELAAGRYLGKQIGFYLIAPEDSFNNGLASSDSRYNCATDPSDQGVLPSGNAIDDDGYNEPGAGDDANGFGRIYFTESKLNNDGNYVHYLIYQSKQNAEHFYFGFEDLFRGGDNDYEDTLVKVEGLVPTCQAKQEVCNGVDDNCNGQVDENVFRDCSTACGAGQETCQFSNDGNPVNDWVGCTAPQPGVEACNGKDDNCNGQIDENVPAGGACVESGCTGQLVCSGGVMICNAPSPVSEVCDGTDNDCNGKVDDLVRPCSTACGSGVESCQFSSDGDPLNDWTGCTAPKPAPEVCDGVDNDCNGQIDDALPAGSSCTQGGCTGKMVCTGGKLVCDAQKPSAEICDGKDNNCDGSIDEGLVRSCLSACGFGTETCEFTADGNPANDWGGCTAPAPQPETCDGVDNDCNGKVDDGVSGEGEPCDATAGVTCLKGKTKCVAGKLVCVGATVSGPEVCDCKDNDCDGQVDEEAPCPGTSKCVECGCRIPCAGVEFGCPAGFACKAFAAGKFCVPDKCATVQCKPDEKCENGDCVNLCNAVTCPTGKVCKQGACVEDNCYGKGCPAGQVCLANQCQADPCAGVTCEAGEFCDHGACRKSCGGAICGQNATCVAGECRPDACEGVACEASVPCREGRCDPGCKDLFCVAGQVCRAGTCVDDPCTGVRCFAPDETCEDGQCISPRTFAGVRSELLASGGGGCACQLPAGDGGGGALLLLALFLVPGLLRARRRLLALLLLVGLSLAACEKDPLVQVTFGDGGPPTRPDVGVCVPSNDGVEVCDGRDNDCNGRIDDGFNLQSDPAHCGSCEKSCLKKGTVTVCEHGSCRDLECAPGFIDFNHDMTDGCEWECTATGAEVCDGKDNDCNGKVDETFDLQKDVENCGKCGNACQLAHAVPKCDAGKCTIQSCEAGYLDKDKDAGTGCEAPCTKSNGGVEVCDGKDNDCNGVVDDPAGKPVDFATDSFNCGACGVVCSFANGTGSCQGGKCVLTACQGKYLDADKSSDNGCECLPEGVELCDARDNDCNGLTDDNLGSPGPCGSTVGECKAGATACQNGVVVCQGAVGPQPELCDGKDNDCSGVVDDHLPSLGICGTSKGECKTGVNVCKGAQIVCEGAVSALAEACDGKDNDCNGVVDDNLTGYPGTCGTDVGECVAGQKVCQGGVPSCLGSVDAKPEMCDGKDTDCDGGADPAACLWPGAGREKRLDDLSTATLGAANSVQLHVAGSGARMLAVWLDRRAGDRGDLYANLSADGGKTWLASDIAVDATTASKAEPRAAFGGPSAGGGRAYVAYEQFDSAGQRDVYLRRSTNGGQTWLAPVLVEKVGTATGDALFVRLAVWAGATAGDADRVAVCWERIAVDGPINPNLRCNLSTNSGQTFASNDVQVNTTANNAFVPEIAIDQSWLYVAWQQGSFIRAARAPLSLPLAFASETALTGQPGQEPRIATDGAGTVLVVWEDLRSPLIAIRASRSTNSGQSWMSDGARVDLDVVDGDSTSPALAMRPGGRVFVAWEDTSRGQQDIYANFSDDGGLSWSPVARRVDGDTAGSKMSLHPAIAVAPNNSNVYVVWEDYRNGSHRDIYATLSLDNGVTWTRPDYRVNESSPAGASDARGPQIWASPGRLGIVWMDNRHGAPGALTTGSNADIWSSYLE